MNHIVGEEKRDASFSRIFTMLMTQDLTKLNIDVQDSYLHLCQSIFTFPLLTTLSQRY